MWSSGHPVTLSTMTNSQSVKIMSKKHAYASRALLWGGLFAVAICLAAGTAGAVVAGAATPSAAPPYSVSVQAEHTLTTIGTAALGPQTRRRGPRACSHRRYQAWSVRPA